MKKENLEIFTIMDKDKCSDELFKDYKSKKMFKKHWMYELITPIYNIECLRMYYLKPDILIHEK